MRLGLTASDLLFALFESDNKHFTSLKLLMRLAYLYSADVREYSPSCAKRMSGSAEKNGMKVLPGFRKSAPESADFLN